MDLNNYIEEIHENSKDKGWWDKPHSVLETHALIHSEIAEATESVRNGDHAVFINPVCYPCPGATHDCTEMDCPDAIEKPEGEAVELVDAVVRVLDYFGHKGWGCTNFKTTILTTPNALNKHAVFHAQVGMAATGALIDDEDWESDYLNNVVNQILEYFELRSWDFEEVLKLKMAYNKTRSYRHGGKKH